MPTVHVKIKNIEQIRHAFGQAPKLMNDELKEAFNRSAVTVQRESMQRTPVLTGRLRASHTFTRSGIGTQMRAEIYPTANYGIFVHEGTRFMHSRPFLKEGLDASTQEIQDNFTRAVQNVFDKIGRQV